MLELGSLLKSFLLAIMVMLLLQTKVDNQTLESHLNDWARNSWITNYVQGVASGAVVVIQQTAGTAKHFISEKLGHSESPQKASRLNINLQRSESYQNSHPQKDSE